MSSRLALLSLALLSAFPPAARAQSAFMHQIPIKLPKGAGGVQPDLALVYTPSTANGLIGVGWQLTGLSEITRVNYGSGIGYAGADTYGHTTLGVLVRQPDGSYRTKKESFTKLVPSGFCGDGPCSWTAYDRSGAKLHYGGTTDSQLLRQGTASVRTWAISKVEDLFGNHYEITYNKDVSAGIIVPGLITYTKGPGISTYRTVQFVYARRVDTVDSYAQGSFERLPQRLTRILISQTNGTTTSPIRQYDLEYECGADFTCTTGITGRSRLIAVTESGLYGSGQLGHSFTWQVGQSGFAPTPAYANPSPYPVSRDASAPRGEKAGYELADLNSDGKLDMIQGLYIYGSYYRNTWLNNGNGWTSTAAFVLPNVDFAGRDGGAPAGWDSGLRIADLNGDGRPDLIRGWHNYGQTYRHAWLNNGGNCSTTSCAWVPAPQYAPPADFTGRDSSAPGGWDSGVRIADINDDGKPDLIHGWDNWGTQYRNAWINTGQGWAQSTAFAPFVAFTLRNSTFPGGRDTGARLVDITGDSKPDLLYSVGTSNNATCTFTNNAASAWINTGTGWTPSATLAPPAPLDYGGFASPASFMDVNQDGKTDLLLNFTCYYSGVATYRSWAWLSTGDSWVQSTAWAPPAAPGTTWWSDANRVVDVNADGLPDIVSAWIDLTGASHRAAWVNTGGGWRQDNSFAPPVDLDYTFQSGYGDTSAPTGVDVADLNGDGRPEYMQGWYNYGTLTRNAWLTPGAFPDLMVGVNNGINGTIAVAYTPAPQIPNAIKPSSTAPGISNTSPRQLVTRVVTSDGRGGAYGVRYEYSDGRVYPGTIPNQRDLGFAKVRAVDEQTGQFTDTYYNQSPGYEGTVSRLSAYAATGQLLSSTSHVYDLVTPATGTELARDRQTKTDAYELGIFAFSQTTDTTYDPYGNATVKDQFATGLPTVTVTTTYVNDAYQWVLGRPTRVTTTSAGTVLSDIVTTWSGNVITAKSEWLNSVVIDTVVSPTDAWLTTTFGYDANGNITSVTEPWTNHDEFTRTTTTTWDATRAYPESVTNALGHTASTIYNLDGLPTSVTDPNGRTTTTVYDGLGRKVSENRPDGGVTAWFYVSWGTPDQHTRVETRVGTSADPRILYRYEYFDGTGFKYQIRTSADCPVMTGMPAGLAVVETQKDFAGRASRTSRPYCYQVNPPADDTVKGFTTTSYDAAGRIASVLAPDGKVTSYAHGPTFESVTDANSRTTTRYFDARSRVTSLVDAAGQTTQFGYDSLGRVISAVLPDGSITTATFDSLNRRTSVTAPQLGTSTYAYDELGNVRIASFGGKSVAFEYDALNRVTLKTPQGETAVPYTWDESQYANGVGRLTTVSDDAGIRHFAYSATGALRAMTLLTDGKSYTQQVDYDLGGRVLRMTYPNGSYARYWYTVGGNLMLVTLDDYMVAYWSGHDATGKPRRVEYANGVATTYSYDTMGHLTALATRKDTTTHQDLTYDWYSLPDTGGLNIGSITDRRTNKWIAGCNPDGSSCNTDETQTYTYDELYRLRRAVGVWGTKNYLYDVRGNPTTFEGVVNRSLAYDGQRVMSGTGLSGVTYDAAGNMTAKVLDGTSWTYDWTAEGRLASVFKNGATTPLADMTYDADGQRVKKVYAPLGGTSVTTTYFGNIYERRTYGDGSPERHTLHVFGNGYLVASVTKEGAIVTAERTLKGWRTELAAASMYDTRSVTGAARKVAHLFAAIASHPEASRWVSLGCFALFALFIIAGVARSLARGLSRFPAKLRVGSAAVSLVFAFTACSGGPGGPGQKQYKVLVGDTTDGPAVGTFYYHRNHVNSSAVITDASGAERTRLVYLPFGEISQPHSVGIDTVTLKYTGNELDEETGLYANGARYYDPAIGRFTSPDPFVPSATDAQSYNRYGYARNNPIVYVDPTGHSFEFIGDVFRAIGNAFQYVRDAVADAARWLGDLMIKIARFVASAANYAAQIICAAAKNPAAIAGFVMAVALSIATSNPAPLLLWAKATAAAIGAQSLALAAGVRNPTVITAIGAVAALAASAATMKDFLQGLGRALVDQAVARIQDKSLRLAVTGAIIIGAIVVNKMTQEPEQRAAVDPGEDVDDRPLYADASRPGEAGTATDACNCRIEETARMTKWQSFDGFEKVNYVFWTGAKILAGVGALFLATAKYTAIAAAIGVTAPWAVGLIVAGGIAFGVAAIGMTLADVAHTTTAARPRGRRRIRARRWRGRAFSLPQPCAT